MHIIKSHFARKQFKQASDWVYKHLQVDTKDIKFNSFDLLDIT